MVDFAAISNNMLDGLLQIGAAPFKNLEIWWYLFPILGLWFALEFYFGIYKAESMGWNTALANAFSFAWVSIEGMRVLFEKGLDFFWVRFIVLLLAIFYSGIVIYLVFTHKVKEKYAFIAASPHAIYFLSAVSIMWMHGVLDLSFWVLLDLIIIFFLLALLFMLIKKILPNKSSDKNNDFEYEKVGFNKGQPNDMLNSQETSVRVDPMVSRDSDDAGSALDFMNFGK